MLISGVAPPVLDSGALAVTVVTPLDIVVQVGCAEPLLVNTCPAVPNVPFS